GDGADADTASMVGIPAVFRLQAVRAPALSEPRRPIQKPYASLREASKRWLALPEGGAAVARPTSDITIRPARAEDAEDIWHLARQEGVFENTLILPSDRLDQRRRQLEGLTSDEHYFVADDAGTIVGLAGMGVGRGRLRHSGHLFIYV